MSIQLQDREKVAEQGFSGVRGAEPLDARGALDMLVRHAPAVSLLCMTAICCACFVFVLRRPDFLPSSAMLLMLLGLGHLDVPALLARAGSALRILVAIWRRIR